MVLSYFIKGLLIGFSVAAPVGPIGVLTIKRSLAEGRLSGFVTGLGAAVADTCYGAVAGLGLSSVSGFLMEYAFWLKLIGGLFLLYLGIRSFRSQPASEAAKSSSGNLLSHFISTLFLTVTNPATIFSFLAIFAGLGLGTQTSDTLASLLLVTGVFLGSAAWWLTLSSVVGTFRSAITSERLIWVNRLSGIIIIAFGVFALYSIICE